MTAKGLGKRLITAFYPVFLWANSPFIYPSCFVSLVSSCSEQFKFSLKPRNQPRDTPVPRARDSTAAVPEVLRVLQGESPVEEHPLSAHVLCLGTTQVTPGSPLPCAIALGKFLAAPFGPGEGHAAVFPVRWWIWQSAGVLLHSCKAI